MMILMVLRCYTFGCLVFDVAMSPIWMDLCRGHIVGRFSPYEKALVEAIMEGVY